MKRALAVALDLSPWALMPCRELTNECDPTGECLRCGAAAGETCRKPVIVAYRQEQER